jgi:hypothetical protein
MEKLGQLAQVMTHPCLPPGIVPGCLRQTTGIRE